MKRVLYLFVALILLAGCIQATPQSQDTKATSVEPLGVKGSVGEVERKECDCVYNDKVYSPGSVVKMSGKDYECVCGEWKEKKD